MAREFNTVGVVGLGTMGAGIVEVFARNGIDVVAVEISEAALERGRATLAGSTDRAVAKGKLAAADRDALHERVHFAVGLNALHSVDLVIEAVPEHLDLKQRIFAELDRVCPTIGCGGHASSPGQPGTTPSEPRYARSNSEVSETITSASPRTQVIGGFSATATSSSASRNQVGASALSTPRSPGAVPGQFSDGTAVPG